MDRRPERSSYSGTGPNSIQPNRVRRWTRLALLALLTLPCGSACDVFEFEGWLNQPLPIEVRAGLPLVKVSYRGGKILTAVIDSGSPLSVINENASAVDIPGGPVSGFDLLLGLGQSSGNLRLQDGDRPDVTRFIFKNLSVIDVPLQPIGLGRAIPVEGLLGATLLSHFAVHLAYAPAMLMLRDSIGDTDTELASDCRAATLLLEGGFAAERCTAVFRTPVNGGGTMLLGNEALQLPASRLTVTLCVAPHAFEPTSSRPTPPSTSGTPISALVATGLGTSVISRSAFERLRARMPELVETPRQTLHLQTGSLSVSTTQIPRIALVADRTLDLGPCGELARRRRLLLAPAVGVDPRDEGHEGAAVAIAVRPVTFAIVADTAGLLQGLRQELRSIVADIDVVLGGSFFASFEFDLDYPNGRTILQCAPGIKGDTCRVMPACTQSGEPACPKRR